MSKPPTIALLPLDERPVNTRYPEMLAEIAGARVLLPPMEMRGYQREPADRDAVAAWLRGAVPEADAGIIASAEFLLYGNLINARISTESAVAVMPRLRILADLSGAAGDGQIPLPPVYAFSLITRVSNADDSVEEPEYWATYGTRFYRYSALLHRRDAGALEAGDAARLLELEDEIPATLRADWLQRRLRNHTVNLGLLDLAARGSLAFLLLTSDDTSLWGTPSREKAWLEGWTAMLGDDTESRVMLHPGADEVGSALVARLLVRRRRPTAPPSIFPLYAIPGDDALVAPYEDRAVRLTVEGQIRACGAQVANSIDAAEIVLGVLTPVRGRGEFRAAYADDDRAAREPHYRTLFETLGALQVSGRMVAIGDVAYPNGADPLAVEMLLDPTCPLDPAGLGAYGAWNTAGNTLGVVVAQAVCALFVGDNPAQHDAQCHFLTHRFLEDWGYQAVVRREARDQCRAAYGTPDPNPDDPAQIAFVATAIEAGLGKILVRLQQRGIGAGLRIVPRSVRLPWRRTFEVDFALERITGVV